ncbi:unnamed protein product, partial [Effrenium voratum]
MADPDAAPPAPPAPPAEPAPPAPWRGRWRLTGSKINCRSSPSAADPSNIICKLRQGAVVVVEELQASDWCLLKGPPPVAGRFVRLRMSDTAERCWEFLGPEDEDVSPGELWQAVQQFPHTSSVEVGSLRILVVQHQPNMEPLKEFLDAGRHSVEVWPVERVAWREAWRVIPQLFDAVVLSGGGIGVTLEVRTLEEKALTKMEVPILGICFGMQLTARAFVRAEAGSKATKGLVRPVAEKREYKLEQVSNAALSLQGGMMYHRKFGVRCDLGADCLEVLALDESGQSVAALRHRTRPILAFQGHPEMKKTQPEVKQQVFRLLELMVQ